MTGAAIELRRIDTFDGTAFSALYAERTGMLAPPAA
jgi:hypothetical protein